MAAAISISRDTSHGDIAQWKLRNGKMEASDAYFTYVLLTQTNWDRFRHGRIASRETYEARVCGKRFKDVCDHDRFCL